jgi:hypothetical protein
MWKAHEDEVDAQRKGVQLGTYYQREVAMHDLDRALGGPPVVPSTVSRNLNGQEGALQAFVDGKRTFELRVELEELTPVAKLAAEPSVRRMFLLDVIAANDDRHGANALWRRKPHGGFEVSAIDHGTAFPEGTPKRFFFAIEPVAFARAMLTLDETSIRELRALSLPRVAAILRRQPGITSRQIRETLARIRSLQLDPEQLARLSQSESPTEAMRKWLGREPEKRGLGRGDLAEIDRLAGARR